MRTFFFFIFYFIFYFFFLFIFLFIYFLLFTFENDGNLFGSTKMGKSISRLEKIRKNYFAPQKNMPVMPLGWPRGWPRRLTPWLTENFVVVMRGITTIFVLPNSSLAYRHATSPRDTPSHSTGTSRPKWLAYQYSGSVQMYRKKETIKNQPLQFL